MMLNRIGTFAYGQTLVNEFSRIQARTMTTQQQISTGKVGDQFADVKDKAGVLAAAKMKSAEVTSFTQATKEVMTRLNIQDLHLQELSDASARLRSAIGDAISTGHAPALSENVKTVFDEVVSILNTKVDGKYIYGGSRSDQPPVNVTTLQQLIAAPAIADIFDNTTVKQSQRVDNNETIETGLLASDIGTDLLQMIKDIATQDNATPFGTNLTAAQTTFLTTQHSALPNVQSGINTIAAINGTRYTQAEQTLDRHDTMASYFKKFISDIEDVDLATAVSNLNQDQVAAQAAGRMIAQMNQLSLLNFLPTS